MCVDDWFLNVSRAEIDAGDIIPTMLELGPLLAPENVRRFQRKVSLFVDGYDDDPRDVYAIDEVRRWLQLVDVAFPFWFYFLAIGPRSSLQWITFGLCGYRQVEGGKVIEPAELQRFVQWHLYALATLCAAHRIPGPELDRMAAEIHQFFGV
jgi:hypothetical protein